MVDSSKRLIKFGFYNGKFKEDYPEYASKWMKKDKEGKPAMSDEDKNKILNGKDFNAEKYADHDTLEIQRDQIMTMDYPKPVNKYYMIYEVPHESIEPIYYWCLGHLTNDWGFPVVHKISDIFTAAEHSSFYGASAQRLGLAQDKVAQYLATIGKMVKDMFQLVRELRWIDERRAYYKDADEGNEGAEIALKGLWTDMVDGVVGGQRSSSNIFVMAQQLQFSALPDLFFSIHVTKKIVSKITGKPADKVQDEDIRKQIDAFVDKRAEGFNKELKNLLKRKLYQYHIWRAETKKEIDDRRKFTLDYLRQHSAVIRMYMTWVKPYLKHIRKLGADTSKMGSADLISAFEGSLIEIEILGQMIPKGNKEVYTCIMITFQYRTRPQMQFSQEGGYHRGPLHQGETKIFWRAYAWTQDQIEAYKQMKDDEDMELLKTIDSTVDSAMNALGDDLKKYLKQAEQQHVEEKKEEKPQPRKQSLFEPFAEVGKGFAETFSAIIPKAKKGGSAADKGKEMGAAIGGAKGILWQNYKNFKKAHRLLTW